MHRVKWHDIPVPPAELDGRSARTATELIVRWATVTGLLLAAVAVILLSASTMLDRSATDEVNTYQKGNR